MGEAKSDFVWDASTPAAESARGALPAMAADFFRTGRKIVTSEPSADDLHQLRLTVKRFRYTLELFRPCYGNGLEQRLEALKRMQDHLGAMNDCEATAALVELTLPDADGTPAFLQILRTRGDEERQKFLRHWHETFDAPGQEAWWVEYLSRPESLGSGRALEHSEAESNKAFKKTASG